jgi:CRP-like cAMP-binding protein
MSDYGNLLLDNLPQALGRRLVPQLERVFLPLGSILHESNEVLEHVYFPIDCIVSLLHLTSTGATTEISVVGKEGIVGIPVFLGDGVALTQAIVQSEGSAYRLPANKLKIAFDNQISFRELLLRYTLALFAQTSQTAVCNRHHSIVQQLCRWLLLSLDRVPDNRLHMTHSLIANMLGVRREGVTNAAGKLQQCGVIEYSRGTIVVTNRPALEEMCCECYASVQQKTAELLPGVK